MAQSKKQSLVETLVGLVVGFLISMGVLRLVALVWNLDIKTQDNLAITAIFTVTSFLRGYLIRRLFNKIWS